jgi:hypothetical protein
MLVPLMPTLSLAVLWIFLRATNRLQMGVWSRQVVQQVGRRSGRADHDCWHHQYGAHDRQRTYAGA